MVKKKGTALFPIIKLFLILIVLSFILGFSSSQYFMTKKLETSTLPIQNFTPEHIPTSKGEIIKNCKGLDIQNTSLCLRDNIATFYIYKSREDGLNLSFKELKEGGGDCHDWSLLYAEMGEELGFNANTRQYNGIVGVFSGHRWAMIWDDGTHCKIDLLEVECYENVEKT